MPATAAIKLDLDFVLPICNEAPFSPPQLDGAAFLEFIEFNRRIASQDGTLDHTVNSRPRPVDAFFVLP